MKIASGLLVKQSLFDCVLGESGQTNFVDFSTKGRSQFIQQLEEFVNEIEQTEPESVEESKVTEETETLQTEVAGQKPTDEIDLSDDATEPQEEPIAAPTFQPTVTIIRGWIGPIDCATDFAFQIICFNFGGIKITKMVVRWKK